MYGFYRRYRLHECFRGRKTRITVAVSGLFLIVAPNSAGTCNLKSS